MAFCASLRNPVGFSQISGKTPFLKLTTLSGELNLSCHVIVISCRNLTKHTFQIKAFTHKIVLARFNWYFCFDVDDCSSCVTTDGSLFGGDSSQLDILANWLFHFASSPSLYQGFLFPCYHYICMKYQSYALTRASSQNSSVVLLQFFF